MTEINSTQNNDDRWWIAALITVLLLWFLNAFWNPTRAQKLDTIRIDVNNIEKIIEKSTPKSVRYYAVYKDANVSDIVPIGKTVIEYIQLYKQNGIKPSIGLKLKDGRIVSIIKIPKKYAKAR